MLAFKDAMDVRKYAADKGLQFVSFFVSDIDGRFRQVTFPIENFTQKVVEEGTGFDASNLGFAKVHHSDMLLVPDLNACFEDPVDDSSHTLYMICNIMELGGSDAFTQDLRHILSNAMGALRREGIADEAKVGVELEFYVIDELKSIMTPRETSYRVESQELASPPGGEELYRVFSNRGYFRVEPNDHFLMLPNEIVTAMNRLGIDVKYHHHEVGSSQQEIELQFLPIEFGALATVLAKHVCHRVARRHGRIITFIPKLLPGEAGNGMHVHHFLLKDGRNVFHDPAGLYQLSPTALSYLGGVLKNASPLLALTNPTTNSYRRLVPGFEAPVKAVFAEGNRSAAIRIPGYIRDPQERRFEFRTIDATCNPFLAYAAIVMAGIDGVRRGLDPVKEGFGPFECNLYDLPREQMDRIQSFPDTLENALQCLADDHAFLLRDQVFPPHLIEKWIAAKRKDIADMRQVPHPWEIARYYDL